MSAKKDGGKEVKTLVEFGDQPAENRLRSQCPSRTIKAPPA
jgi:hypothetical protein